MTIRCTKFRPFAKNTLRGFCDLELTRVGLVIHDCTWHSKAGREWINFPAESYVSNGETRWKPLVEFAASAGEAREQFQRQALEAVHAVAGRAAEAVSS
jgi:hypothetical protein